MKLSCVCLSLTVAVASGACLPERFRVLDAEPDSADAVVIRADRVESEAIIDVVSDREAPADASPDAVDLDARLDATTDSSDATVAVTDSGDASVADAVADSRPDAVCVADATPDRVGADAGACAPSCTVNSACVMGACVPRNCLGAREMQIAAGGSLGDADFVIDPDGIGPETPFSVYCADLATATPLEYLNVAPANNVFHSTDIDNRCGNWDTSWSKVRLRIDSSGPSIKYAIDSSEYRFTSEFVDASCRSRTTYINQRRMGTNSNFHRMYGIASACEFERTNQYFRADLRDTGFRFPRDTVSRFKINNFSFLQANTFVFVEGAYGYRVSVDARCGAIVPIDWETGARGESLSNADLSAPVEHASTWRLPIIRERSVNSDPAPGSSRNEPIVASPLGSDIRRTGIFQAYFNALPGAAPAGLGCAPIAGVTRAVWVSVEVPARTRRRFVAAASAAHPTILRLANSACDDSCREVSAPPSIGGTSTLLLDNSMNDAPRTFVIAASPRQPASLGAIGEFIEFVVQNIDPAICNALAPGMGGALSAPTITAPVSGTMAASRRVTFQWQLAECATGAYIEHCLDAACTRSACVDGTTQVPCSYHMPSATPDFTVTFRAAGTYFVRARSLRFWIPGAVGENFYGEEVLGPLGTAVHTITVM